MISMKSNVINYGTRLFSDIDEMWNTVAYQQAKAWKQLELVYVFGDRYALLETLPSWRYAREVADYAMTKPEHEIMGL